MTMISISIGFLIRAFEFLVLRRPFLGESSSSSVDDDSSSGTLTGTFFLPLVGLGAGFFPFVVSLVDFATGFTIIAFLVIFADALGAIVFGLAGLGAFCAVSLARTSWRRVTGAI